MTSQHDRTVTSPPTDRSRPGDPAPNAVPGLLEDIAMAAAKIYYLTAADPGKRRRPSTVDR